MRRMHMSANASKACAVCTRIKVTAKVKRLGGERSCIRATFKARASSANRGHVVSGMSSPAWRAVFKDGSHGTGVICARICLRVGCLGARFSRCHGLVTS